MTCFMYSCLIATIAAISIGTSTAGSNVTYDAGCLSPDGSKLVFKVGVELRLLEIASKGVRAIGMPVGLEAAPFTGNARLWDPESRSLVFACFNKEGTASTICLLESSQPISRRLHPSFRDSGSRTSPSWSPSGRNIAYFLQRRDDPLEHIAWFDLKESREHLASLHDEGRTFVWPLIWSSDESTVYAAEMDAGVLLGVDLKKKQHRNVLNVQSVLASLSPVIPLDAKALIMTGKTSRGEILFFVNYGVASLLAWNVADGKIVPVGPCSNGQVSPDSRRVLYARHHAGRRSIFLYERNNGASYVVEHDLTADCDRPVWRDDNRIIFRKQYAEIWQMNLKRGSKERLYPEP